MKGQVINRVGNITYFGDKLGRGFGKGAAHSLAIFLGVPPGGSVRSEISFSTRLL